MIAATDSRHMAPIADAIYRFSPVRAKSEDLSRFHGTNERISVANHAELIRFYHRLLLNAAGTRGKTMNEQVLLEIRGAVATLTLNRPQALNALGLEMGRALLARAEELQKAAGVKVVVVTGAGEHFMAGGDIKEFHTMLAAPPESGAGPSSA
jgi:hypothetical protein